MKKRRVLLLALLALLLFVGIPTGFIVREIRRGPASRDLIIAIKADDAPAALAALKAGANPDYRDHTQDKPLSSGGYLQAFFHNLFYHSARNAPPTALLLCYYDVDGNIAKDNPLLVKALLDAGANPNLTGGLFAASPMIWAAGGNDPHILRLMLEHGGDVHQKDMYGLTPLHWAAVNGNVEGITMLLEAGADIDAQDGDGDTPLHLACREGNYHEEAVSTLLLHHAKLNVRDKEGYTPLDWALYRESTRLSELLRKAGAKTGTEMYVIEPK